MYISHTYKPINMRTQREREGEVEKERERHVE
jgi:hypothetical protein